MTKIISSVPSRLPPAAAFADLASIAIEQDDPLDAVERRLRARLRALEHQVTRAVTALLSKIERMIDDERRGQHELTDEELTNEIEEMYAAEADLKPFLRSAERTFRKLAQVAARGGTGRRDLAQLAGREFVRILSRLISGLQEGRWMLMGLRDGREPRDGGIVVTTPQDLRRLLTIA